MSTLQKQFIGCRLFGEMYLQKQQLTASKNVGLDKDLSTALPMIMKKMQNLNLLTHLREDDEITVKNFVTFDDNLTTLTAQINNDLINWRQQAQEEAVKEVLPDTSSASQAVNFVSDDDDDQGGNAPGTLLHQKLFNTSMVCFIFSGWKTRQHSSGLLQK